MTRLLERSGFNVLWLGHPGARYSLAHLAYKLDRAAKIGLTATAAQWFAKSSLGRYSIPLNLYDIVTVVAQKEGAQHL